MNKKQQNLVQVSHIQEACHEQTFQTVADDLSHLRVLVKLSDLIDFDKSFIQKMNLIININSDTNNPFIAQAVLAECANSADPLGGSTTDALGNKIEEHLACLQVFDEFEYKLKGTPKLSMVRGISTDNKQFSEVTLKVNITKEVRKFLKNPDFKENEMFLCVMISHKSTVTNFNILVFDDIAFTPKRDSKNFSIE